MMRIPDDASASTDLSDALERLDILRSVSAATASHTSGVGEEKEMDREVNGDLRDENRRLRAEIALLRSMLPADASPLASDLDGFYRDQRGGIKTLERKLDRILEHVAANSAAMASLTRGLIDVKEEVVGMQRKLSNGHSGDWSDARGHEPNYVHRETQTDDNNDSMKPSAKVHLDDHAELAKAAPANHTGKGDTRRDSTIATPSVNMKITAEVPLRECRAPLAADDRNIGSAKLCQGDDAIFVSSDGDEENATPLKVRIIKVRPPFYEIALPNGGETTVHFSESGLYTADEYKVLQSLVIRSTECFGGSEGNPFDDVYEDSKHCGRITKIAVRECGIIDAIGITYSGNLETMWHGGYGGREHDIVLRKNEFVTEVSVCYGRLVNCLTFLTNMGRRFGPYGEKELFGGLYLRGLQSKEAVLKAPKGFMLVGIHGRSGKYLDGIGFHWGPVTSAVRKR